MKRVGILFLVLVCSITLFSCGSKNTSNVKIDYGKSSIYETEDMDKAIKLIKKEFNSWDGCEMHSISYAGDENVTKENIKSINEKEDSNKYTQCIVFKSNFHSPKKATEGWEADMEYTDWEWWLARSNNGNWKLVNWGY